MRKDSLPIFCHQHLRRLSCCCCSNCTSLSLRCPFAASSHRWIWNAKGVRWDPNWSDNPCPLQLHESASSSSASCPPPPLPEFYHAERCWVLSIPKGRVRCILWSSIVSTWWGGGECCPACDNHILKMCHRAGGGSRYQLFSHPFVRYGLQFVY